MKTIEKLFSRLGYVSKKRLEKALELKENKLRVLEIYPEKDQLGLSLGIDDDRRKSLHKEIMRCLHKCETKSEILENLSLFAKNPNELAYMCYAYGDVDTNHMGGFLGKLMEGLTR